MPKNVGRYQQGGKLTHAPAPIVESGMPHRAAPAGPVPRGDHAGFESHKAAPANDARKP